VTPAEGLLKMAELAEQSGVSAGTIKHYLREGLLPEPVRTSRNMAYYPPEFVERIRLIKRLQEDRFMPLRLIKGVIDEDPAQFIPYILEARHSRFPVIGENKDDVVGILLAKELLNFYANPDAFNLRDTLRPAVFVPESKRLNVLLRDFRANRNHIAIVVDEYGGVSGLVTIEDVLEQIVGDIEDEYDFDEAEDNIIPEASGAWRVKAQTEIADFNETLGSRFSSEEFNTVGGLVLRAFGRLPKRGEATTIGAFRFRVVRADSRRIYTLQVERVVPQPAQEAPAGSA